MARGWESKSVEAQQEDRAAARVKAPAVTPDAARRAQARQRVQMALAQAEQDLATASHPARRQALSLAIADLRRRLDGPDAD